MESCRFRLGYYSFEFYDKLETETGTLNVTFWWISVRMVLIISEISDLVVKKLKSKVFFGKATAQNFVTM